MKIKHNRQFSLNLIWGLGDS